MFQAYFIILISSQKSNLSFHFSLSLYFLSLEAAMSFLGLGDAYNGTLASKHSFYSSKSDISASIRSVRTIHSWVKCSMVLFEGSLTFSVALTNRVVFSKTGIIFATGLKTSCATPLQKGLSETHIMVTENKYWLLF